MKKMKFTPRSGRGCRYWFNLFGFSAVTLFFGYLAFMFIGHTYYLSKGWANPGNVEVCCLTPADQDLDYEEFSLTARDGVVVKGWYIPGSNEAAIIFSHSIGANRMQGLELAQALNSYGYGVVLYDIRSHGDSDEDILPYGGPEGLDIIAIAEYLESRPDVQTGQIGAIGWSLGGQVSIMAAAQSDLIQAVVSDGECCTTYEDMIPDTGLNGFLWDIYDRIFFARLSKWTGVENPLGVTEAVALISPRPILFIGELHSSTLAEAHYAAALEPKSLWLPDAGHIGAFGKFRDEYLLQVIEFFDSSLLDQ